MIKGGIAAQLYTVRDKCQTPEAFAQTLKKVRAIGYRAAQLAGTGSSTPQEIKAMFDAADLYICSSHTGLEALQNDLPAVIAAHKLWNCKDICIPSMPQAHREAGEAGFIRFAHEANEVGKKLAAEGISLSYHNHSFEFQRFGKRTGLDIIYSESDPRYLQAEIDTYWVQHGGSDPVAWCARMKNRMYLVHCKDMAIDAGKQLYAEVGEGNLNWTAIIAACREAGVTWYTVEQDICQRDSLESLAISFNNMKAMGLE